jgi:SAM-dependent MidA family methyltransferase
MTPLAARITRLIEASGPISVAQYMALCLSDPEAGYYTTREPFGRGGDFVTAPEVSQMFGELVAIWCIGAWMALGRPGKFTLCEIGPGRGTLMADLLRVVGRIAPDFLAAARVAMVETSPRLVAMQKATLAAAPARIEWLARFEDVPASPLVLVANELFDALPVHQYVKLGNLFRERMVGLDANGAFAFAGGAGSIDAALLPKGSEHAPEGTIFEASPARAALMDAIATRIAVHRGAALLIDYGHIEPGFGDTLQAVRRHEPEDVFANPGEADLTSHVDFAALMATAKGAGCRTVATTQARFLLDLGLLDRAGRLGAGKTDAIQEQIRVDVERLAGPRQMGDLFKVLCVTDEATRVPPFDGGLSPPAPRAD